MEPAGGRAVAVTASLRAQWGRDLIRRCESLAVIDVAGGAVRLLQASDWDVRGDWPDGLLYDVSLPQPGTDGAGRPRRLRRRVPGEAVVHLRWATDPAAPWQGRAPWQLAPITAEALRNLEHGLRLDAPLRPPGKLDLPAFAFEFGRLTRGDIMSRAPAFQSLVGGGM